MNKMQIILCLSLLGVMQQGHAEMDIKQSRSGNNGEEQNKLAYMVNDFGFKLLTILMKQYPNENIVISPASISCLLAMTLLGSVGRSYDELAEALGFSEDILTNRHNHKMFGELLQRLNSLGNDSWSKTMLADAVFVDKGTQLREAYRSFLHRVYKGDILSVDFRDNDKVKEMINEWVSVQTKGKIDEFLKQSLPMNTKVVLVSALYFSGQWAKPFVPEHTKKLSFTRVKDKVMADLMLNFGKFNYTLSLEDGLHMIALPYNDSVNTMYVLKPRLPAKLSLPDLIDRLDYAKIESLINQMTKRDSVVRFPKMEIKSDVDLASPLKELGIRSIFDPREANFALMIDRNTVINKTENELITGINDGDPEQKGFNNIVNRLMNPGVYVDSVMHEVKMKIDEYGTEAAAATISILSRSSEQFYADSPFYMFIRNEKTKLITFSAVVFDPTV